MSDSNQSSQPPPSNQSPQPPPKKRKWWRTAGILALLLVGWCTVRESEKTPETGSEKSVAGSEKPVNEPAKSTQKGEERSATTTAPVPTPQLGSENPVTGSDKQPIPENYKITIKMDAANINHNFAGEGDVIKAPITGEVFVRTAEDTVSMKPVGKDAFGNEVFEGMWIKKKTNKGYHIGRMTKEDVGRGACWRNNEANVCAFPR